MKSAPSCLLWSATGLVLFVSAIVIVAQFVGLGKAIPWVMFSVLGIVIGGCLLELGISSWRVDQQNARERTVKEHPVAGVVYMLDRWGLHVQVQLVHPYCKGHCKLEFGTGPNGENLAWIAHVNGTKQMVPTKMTIDGVTHHVCRYVTHWGDWYGCMVPEVIPPWVRPPEEAAPASAPEACLGCG